MVDSVNTPQIPPQLPGQTGITDTPPEQGGVTPPTVNNDPTQNFEDFLNDTSITQVEQRNFSSEVDAAQEIVDNSAFVDPGQTTPV
ncbi:MAG: hypothetical protein AAF675_07025 [Pseudomonadota bacterium]